MFLCFGTLSRTGFVLFGDDDACGDPILLLASEASAQFSAELFVLEIWLDEVSVRVSNDSNNPCE